MIRRFCPTTKLTSSTNHLLFLSEHRRTVFAGPGGLEGGRSRHQTLAGNISSDIPKQSYDNNTNTNNNDNKKIPKIDPVARGSMDPAQVNTQDDPRQFNTQQDPFKAGERNLSSSDPNTKKSRAAQYGKTGMMYYEEKDTPDYYDKDFKDKEEAKRKANMKVMSAAEKRVHAVRGAQGMTVDSPEETQRMRAFEAHLEEEFQHLNKKAAEREKVEKQRSPGKALKGSMVEARKKARETYDYYYMNPDETISRAGLWGCCTIVVALFLFFEGSKDVNSPLWSGVRYPEGLSWDAPVASSPLTEKMIKLDRDVAAANPLHRVSTANPLHIPEDVTVENVTTQRSVVHAAIEKRRRELEELEIQKKELANELGGGVMNLSLIGVKKVD